MRIERLADKIQALERRRDWLKKRLTESPKRLYFDQAELEALEEAAIPQLRRLRAERESDIDTHLFSLMAEAKIDHPVRLIKTIVEAYDRPQDNEGNRAHKRAIDRARELIEQYEARE